MLDEVALRKPGFQEGIKVKLCDGQEWTFPKVRLRLVPKINTEGDIKLETKRDYATDVQKFLEYEVDDENFDFMDWMTRRFAAAAKLLLVNYDLTGQQLAEVLYWEADSDESDDRWKLVDHAVLGLSPKALAVGSDSV